MKLSMQDLQQLEKLEESLWRPETRFDLDYQEKIFAPDFFEFGRSGRIYSREELILSKRSEIHAVLPLQNFQVRVLDERTVQITYISQVQYDTLEKSNRSSIWSKTSLGWELRFHQGTPVR